ncbi:hypothetical protein LXA43DRAFT_1103225 [Ganoderma leucocontextum]|nr:hypothetical protein LXA43DRAFT_1103225 [Ganoderma leucocontextum]
MAHRLMKVIAEHRINPTGLFLLLSLSVRPASESKMNVAPVARKRKAALYESSSEDKESIPFLTPTAQRGTLGVRLARIGDTCSSNTTNGKGNPPKKKAKRNDFELDASTATEDVLKGAGVGDVADLRPSVGYDESRTEQRSRIVGTSMGKDAMMAYDGDQVDLPPEAEKVASAHDALLGTVHAKGPGFNRNFFNDPRNILKHYPHNMTVNVVKPNLRDLNTLGPVRDRGDKLKDAPKVFLSHSTARMA